MPSAQFGFSATCTGRGANSARNWDACDPSTTTTGQTLTASASSTALRRRVRFSSRSNCFGSPMRVEPPGANKTKPQRESMMLNLLLAASCGAQLWRNSKRIAPRLSIYVLSQHSFHRLIDFYPGFFMPKPEHLVLFTIESLRHDE